MKAQDKLPFVTLPEGINVVAFGFDTLKLAEENLAPPSESMLARYGWVEHGNGYTKNGVAQGEPRLTIAPSNRWNTKYRGIYSSRWTLWVEVSFGSWLSGSNLVLFDEDRIRTGLRQLAIFMQDTGGFSFDALRSRVSRLDIAQDIHVGTDSPNTFIERFKSMTLPKYERNSYDSGVTFFSSPTKKPVHKALRNMQYTVYDKEQEYMEHRKAEDLIQRSVGIIRFEARKRASAIRTLTSKLLVHNSAEHVLTMRTIDAVLSKLWSDLRIEAVFAGRGFNREDLFNQLLRDHTTTTALALMKWIDLRSTDHPLTGQIPAHTARRLDKKCRFAGAPF